MADTETSTGTAAPVDQVEVVANLFGALRQAETAPEPVAEAPITPTEAPEPTATPASQETAPEKPDTAAQQAAKLKLLIDGEEVDEDTIVEWKKSGLRQDAFTRKTMELAEQRKQAEQERAKERAETLQKWEQLQQAVESVMPKEPDWVALRQQVLAGHLPEADYQRAAASWLADKQQRDLIAAEKAKAEAAVQQDRQQAMQAKAEADTQRVFELLPEWKDEGKRREQWGQMTSYVKAIAPDVNEADLLNVHPALFKVLADATAYHKLQAQTQSPARVKVVDSPMKPGGQQTAPKTNPVEAAKRRLAQTGKDSDGAELFRALREAGLT